MCSLNLERAERNLQFYLSLPTLRDRITKNLMEDYNLAWEEQITNGKFSQKKFGEHSKL
jgi:hypothetical protein